MKRYLLGFLGAFCLFLLAFMGLAWMALANWMFSSPPLWFEVLVALGVFLPFPLVGDLVSRRSPAAPGSSILVPLAATAVLSALLLSWDNDWPLVLAPLAFPVLYHLGWRWGRP